jgi:hypothetical protein
MNRLIITCLLLTACGKKADDKAAAKAPEVKIDVAAVNALVPADLKDKLVFEERTIERDQRDKEIFKVAAPKGWELDTMFGSFKPVSGDTANWHFFTKMSVGTNCDGRCEPKKWAEVADKVEFEQFAKGTIVKDEKTATSRSMTVDLDDTSNYVRAWWTDGSKRYYTCRAQVGIEHKATLAAFEKACSAVQVPE